MDNGNNRKVKKKKRIPVLKISRKKRRHLAEIGRRKNERRALLKLLCETNESVKQDIVDMRFEELANTTINESAQSSEIEVDSDQPQNTTFIDDLNGALNDFFSQTNSSSGSSANLFQKQTLNSCDDRVRHNLIKVNMTPTKLLPDHDFFNQTYSSSDLSTNLFQKQTLNSCDDNVHHNLIELNTTPTKLLPEHQISEKEKTPVQIVLNGGQTLCNTLQKAPRCRKKFKQQQTCQADQESDQIEQLWTKVHQCESVLLRETLAQKQQLLEKDSEIKILKKNIARLLALVGKRHLKLPQQLNSIIQDHQGLTKKQYVILQSDKPHEVKYDQRLVNSKLTRYKQFIRSRGENVLKAARFLKTGTLRYRADIIEGFLIDISGRDDPKDIAVILSKFLQCRRDVQKELASALKSEPASLTQSETLDLKHELGLSCMKMRKLKRFLRMRNVDILTTFSKLENESKLRQLKTTLEFKEIAIVQKNNELTLKPNLYVKSLSDFATEIFNRLIEEGDIIEDDGFQKEIWLAIGGDKGGLWTKLTMSFLNVSKPNRIRNINIIGLYEGPDSAENLRSVYGQYKSQFDELQQLKLLFPLNDGSKEYRPLKIFLVGDIMFLSAFMGHLGPNSKNPCLLCEIPQCDLKAKHYEEKLVQLLNKYPTRTFDCIDKSKSQQMMPLFPISPANIAPPVLHIPLGLVTALYKMIESECRAIDLESLQQSNPSKKFSLDVKQLEKDYEKSVLNSEAKKAELELQEKKLDLCQAIVDYLENAVSHHESTTDPEGECNSVVCLTNVKTLATLQHTVVQCDFCSKWYHSKCMKTFHEMLSSSEEAAGELCLMCSSDVVDVESIAFLMKKRLSMYVDEIKICADNFNEAQEIASNYYNIVKESNGKCVQMLLSALKTLRVCKFRFNAGVFVGNDMFKLLKQTTEIDGPALLTAPLQSKLEKQKIFYDILSLLSKIFDIICRPKFLSNEEITKLEILCNDLAVQHAQNFSDMNTTVKMHMLIEHVPEFARRHKTVGMLSEQGIECLHARLNSISRLITVRGSERRLRMIYNHHHQLSSVKNRSDFVSVPRVKKKLCTNVLHEGEEGESLYELYKVH